MGISHDLEAENQGKEMWKWREKDGLPYLTCSLLESWPHGFFTRHFSPQTPGELVHELHSEAQVFRVKQVHGNRVLKTREFSPVTGGNPSPNPLEEADGIITEQRGEAVWVCTADCVPVLLGDIQTGQVAAIHAGWRGTAGKIVPEAVAHFLAQGSVLENLRVGLGPAIGGEVYQVSWDVVEQLGRTLDGVPQNHSQDLLEFFHDFPHSPLLPDPEPGKCRVDVRGFNWLQLLQLGLQPDQMGIAPFCTFQEPEHFCSYRRDGLKNVQWSGIVSGL